MASTFSREELLAASEPRFVDRRMVRFQDIDAAGIIFFPRVPEYFCDAYIGMLLAHGFDLPRALEDKRVNVPLVHAEADYLAPLRFGDPVLVEVALVRLQRSSFSLGYRVRRAGDGGVACLGQTSHVCVDGATFRSCPIPEPLRAALLGEAQPQSSVSSAP